MDSLSYNFFSDVETLTIDQDMIFFNVSIIKNILDKLME